jgi:hypothetical protein
VKGYNKMESKGCGIILMVVLFLSILFGGLGVNQVNAVSTAKTIYGIADAIHGQPGTYIYVKDNMYVFGWLPAANEARWAIINVDKLSIIDWSKFSGNRSNLKTVSDFIKLLESDGYQLVSPESVPTSIKVAVDAATLSVIGGSLIKMPMFVLPMSIFDEFQPTPDGGFKG